MHLNARLGQDERMIFKPLTYPMCQAKSKILCETNTIEFLMPRGYFQELLWDLTDT